MIELQAAAGYELMTAATVCSESARERRFSLGYRPIREGMVLCKKEGLYWNDITGAPSESRLHALIGQRRTERHEMVFFGFEDNAPVFGYIGSHLPTLLPRPPAIPFGSSLSHRSYLNGFMWTFWIPSEENRRERRVFSWPRLVQQGYISGRLNEASRN